MRNWYTRLSQADHWIDHYNHRIEIAGMDPRDARNALVFLERQYEGVARAAANALRDVPPPFGSQAPADVEVQANAILADPMAWLASTPLVQALAGRAALYVARKHLVRPGSR
jgi:hypothetical protein